MLHFLATEARRVAKAAPPRARTGSAAEGAALLVAESLSSNPVAPGPDGAEVGVGTSEPEVLGDDEFDVEHGDEGEELDDHAIQALLDGINDADATVEEDAIEQFDDFVAEVLAASIAGDFDGLYEQGGSY